MSVVSETEILQTLASIKAQISSVLGVLQEAHLSATTAATAVVGVSTEAATMPTPPGPAGGADKQQQGQEEMSREDVKAQRELAKAAKAARKKKGGAEAPGGDVPSKPTPKIIPKEKKAPTTPTQKVDPPKKSEKAPVPTTKQEIPPPQEPTTSAPPPSSTSSTTAPSIAEPIQTKVPPRPTFDTLVEKVHPKFRELGLKYSNHIIRGSNARTRALLYTTSSYILTCHRTPEGKSFKQDLSSQLQQHYEGLHLYRPPSVGMTSAIDGLNEAIRSLPEEEEGNCSSEGDYRAELSSWIDTFIEEKITKAVEAIAQKGADKIQNGDTILTYSLTEAVYETFKLAGEQGKRFNLILAITRPQPQQGQQNYLGEYTNLRVSLGGGVVLNSGQVTITCINLSSIMSFIPRVDKVFLGGHALFTTGGVMARAGSSLVSLCAGSHNVPVLFFCETYKFCDKSPTDAFYSDVFPENKFGFTGDGSTTTKEGDKGEDGPSMAKICYDFTPVDLVTCVITDIDMLPSSSVPVVLRVQESRPLTKCL